MTHLKTNKLEKDLTKWPVIIIECPFLLKDFLSEQLFELRKLHLMIMVIIHTHRNSIDNKRGTSW